MMMSNAATGYVAKISMLRLNIGSGKLSSCMLSIGRGPKAIQGKGLPPLPCSHLGPRPKNARNIVWHVWNVRHVPETWERRSPPRSKCQDRMNSMARLLTPMRSQAQLLGEVRNQVPMTSTCDEPKHTCTNALPKQAFLDSHGPAYLS